jgi:hypothetical protein
MHPATSNGQSAQAAAVCAPRTSARVSAFSLLPSAFISSAAFMSSPL